MWKETFIVISDNLSALTLAGVVFLSCCVLLRRQTRYPPGPTPIPFLGHLPHIFLAGSLTNFANKYRKQYGNIFTCHIRGAETVVVSGYNTMYEVLIKNAGYTSTRSLATLTKESKRVAAHTPGLVWAPFPYWKTLRSFTISNLKEEGMGKASMEPKIHEELEHYIRHYLQPNLSKPFEISHSISQATCNIISQLLYAQRFDYDDGDFNKMISAIGEWMSIVVTIALVEGLPFGGYWVGSMRKKERFLLQCMIKSTMRRYIDEHKMSLDVQQPRDVIDRYLIHSKSYAGEGKSYFSDDNGCYYSFQLYFAGTETTASSLLWALLFMCLHPGVQEKMQKEIDEQIGGDRLVTFKDKLNMPYTEAVILETLRKGNVASTALPHHVSKDIYINGVLIPAGTDLLLNMTSVLNDETVFEEPDKFKPERYLNGNIALKKQRTIPFGIGRRACPGESLARMELFIFFVTFLQRFNVSLPDGSTASDEPVEYITNSPKPFNIIFTPRTSH